MDELDTDQQRVIARAVARMVVTTVLLFAIYALAPVDSVTEGGDAYIRLVIALVIVVVVIGWQLRSIVTADYPQLRAIEGVVIAIPVFIVVFALLYLGLARSDASNFNEHLNRVTALYFTVSVLTTVGFGDITARTDGARLIVTIQMLLDLALLAIVLRVFFSVARTGLVARRRTRRARRRGAAGSPGG